MKTVLELKQDLHVSKRIPMSGVLSLGEFFSLMESKVKEEFVHKMVEHISFGKYYIFRIECIDIEDLDYCYRETFQFEMSEVEPGDSVVTDTRKRLW